MEGGTSTTMTRKKNYRLPYRPGPLHQKGRIVIWGKRMGGIKRVDGASRVAMFGAFFFGDANPWDK